MSTPQGPEPNYGRTLKPSAFTVKEQHRSRVYPDDYPDDYGQVDSGDKDLSRLGIPPGESDERHYRSDLDSSQQALHHTLGSGHTQAAPGDHQHDGRTSLKMGPLEFDPTPGNEGKTRPALTLAATAADIRTFLHNFFEFRDV